MKFLIQKINGQVVHDFAFTLLESIRFHNWLQHNGKNCEIKVRYLDYIEISEPDDIYPIQFQKYHKSYIPIGSVEFVSEFLGYFYNIKLKPINVPEELFGYANRDIFNDDESGIYSCIGKWFVKSNDKIKSYSELIDCGNWIVLDNISVEYPPIGNYQYSKYINIDSEWRAFVYKGKLVGLQNYSGKFTRFPNVDKIEGMIQAYASAPIAYTLDVGVNDEGTFVVEVHNMFSVGLYGFADHSILPKMFYDSFKEILK